jgi:hypothetical protein
MSPVIHTLFLEIGRYGLRGLVFTLSWFKAGPVEAHNSRVMMIADVIHHIQVAPITNGSRKVR